jgi:hypothetical protein
MADELIIVVVGFCLFLTPPIIDHLSEAHCF